MPRPGTASGHLEVPLSLVNDKGDGSVTGSALNELVADAAKLADQGRAAPAFALLEKDLANEGGHHPAGARAALLVEAARILWMLGRYDESLARGRRGLTLAELDGNGRLAADALLRLGLTRHRLGDLAGAREFYEEARSRFRRLHLEERAAAAHNNLGLVSQALGDWDAARFHYQEAIALARREPVPATLGARLQNLGTLQIKCGEWARARTALQEARVFFVESGHRWGMATNTLAMGMLARLQGRAEEANELAKQALTIALAESLPREEAIALELAAALAADAGDLRAALRLDERALAIAERIAPQSDLSCEILRQTAAHVLAAGEIVRAAELLERARAVASALGDRYELALIERIEAERALARGDRELAEQSLLTASGLLGELGERFERGRCFALLARHATTPEEACRWGFRASACFAETGAERELGEIEELVTGRLRPAVRTSLAIVPAAPAAPPRRARIELIGPSRTFSRVRVKVSIAARHGRPVLLRGEPGTGKDLAASALHERSARGAAPFVVVRCREIPRERLLTHLFGDAREGRVPAEEGRMALAEGGTLYLDQIGALPLPAQSALLRYLQRGTYLTPGELSPRAADVRVIASWSTHGRDTRGEGFRRDLLSQFASAIIDLPALRARREDILPLARHFLKLHGHGIDARLTEDAALRLLDHPWFENVRELEESMREALVDAEPGRAIERATIDRILDRTDPAADAGAEAPGESARLESTLLNARIAELERQRILRALAQAHGNKTRASSELGIARKTLYARLRRLGIPAEETGRGGRARR